MTVMTRELKASLAFVERNFNLTKRYWGWEVAWLIYSVAGALAVSLIGRAEGNDRLLLTLVIGAIFWSYLSIVFEFIAEAVQWERWEGTLEYTFMAPVPRLTHLAGMAGGTIVRAVVFSVTTLFAVMLFIPVDLSHANGLSAIVMLAVGTVAFMGLGIASAVFPLIWTEKGLQMAYIVQAIVLLVSGVYYPTSVLPGWLQALSVVSPATYVIEGMRRALLDGADLASLWSLVWPALLIGLLSIPIGLRAFVAAERYAKRTGRLKRSG
jgi:ABC-2 type transport system permease protein